MQTATNIAAKLTGPQKKALLYQTDAFKDTGGVGAELRSLGLWMPDLECYVPTQLGLAVTKIVKETK